jgi:hypothetical protein
VLECGKQHNRAPGTSLIREFVNYISINNMKKNQTQKQNQNTTVADKVVCGLVNRITGGLAMTGMDSDVTSLPIGQCIMVYGMSFKWGYQMQEEWVRIGLYSLTPAGPRIMYAVKAPNRVPCLKESVFARSRGMAEVAAVNWAIGALFSVVPDGGYHMSPEAKIPVDKTRTFFGSMRTWESSVEMFNSCATGWSVDGMKLTAPSIFPVASMESALTAVGGDPDKIDKIGASYAMSRAELAGHIRNEFNAIINSFTSGVSIDGRSAAIAEFRTSIMGELNAQFYRMRNIKENDFVMVKSRGLMASWIDNLGSRIHSKLCSAGVTHLDRNDVYQSMYGIQYALRTWMSLEEGETAKMVIPDNTAGNRKSSARHEVFANPLFHAVSLHPMQIASNVEIPLGGELPQEGRHLFNA